MKYKSWLILAVLLVAALLSCKGKSADFPEEEQNFDKDASYAFGMAMALDTSSNLSRNGVVLDWDEYLKGMKDYLTGKKTRFDEDEAYEKINLAFEAITEKMGAEEKQASIDFLNENSKKPGVITTASGLQYEVIKEGTGQRPTEEDFVRVHYDGRLIDGMVFDSSEGGDPVEFPLFGVIEGWAEGLQLMKVGSIYKLYIPQELGYGVRGGPPGSGIPPFAALIFEVELLDILNY